MSVWLPDWPVQRLRRERPELARRPIALSRADARCERVAACSAEARRRGVRAGMPTPEAQALAGGAALRVAPHQPGADRRALERLAAACERFSPMVALEDADEPSALLLDATGLDALWDSETRLLEDTREFFERESLTAFVAIAPTAGAALAAARWTRATPAESCLVTEDDMQRFASGLPIEALRVDLDTLDRLGALGLLRVGQVLDLPRASLPARFGRLLATRIAQLLGDAEEPLESFRGEPPLALQWRFEAAVTSPESLSHVVDTLLSRLAATMRDRRCGALCVLIAFDCEGAGEPVRVALRLFRPTNSAKELAELAALRLSETRFGRGVERVGVTVASSAPVERRQQQLFDDDPRDDPHELALLVNRIANRVGAENVARVAKRRSVTPERSFALASAIDTPGRPYRLQPAEAERLRTRPLQLSARSDASLEVTTTPDGQPTALRLGGWKNVTRSWGPERIESGWWRRQGVRRDQHWVELDSGARLLIAQDLVTRRWFLLGE